MSHPDDHPSRAELSADAHEEARDAAIRAFHGWDENAVVNPRDTTTVAISRAIDAYLEALNAH